MSTMQALPPPLTIYGVAALRKDWLGCLDRPVGSDRDSGAAPAGWSLDASGVTEVDAAGVQLLLALAGTLRAREQALELVNPSATLASACEALGAAALLAPTGKPAVSP